MSAGHGPVRTWLPVATAVAVTLVGVTLLHRDRVGPEARRIGEIGFAPAAEDPSRPPADPAWAPRALPHDWLRRERGVREAWYRGSFHLDGAPRSFAVYLPSVHMNAAVYVNGARVGDGGRFREPVARNWHRPLYFPVPGRLLRPGENQLELRVKSDLPGRGLLGEVWVGEASSLLPAYGLRHGVMVTTRQVFAVALAVVGTLMLVLSLSPVAGSMYRWFGLLSLVLAFHMVNVIAVDVPVPTRWWNFTRILAVGWLSVFITLLVHRFTGALRPRLERAVLVGASLGALALALTPEPWLSRIGLPLWAAGAVVLGVYPTLLMVRHSARRPTFEVMAVLATGIPLLIFGAHDVLAQVGIWPRANGYYLHFGAPLVTLVVSGILLSRSARALSEAQQLNQELEARVAQREAVLEANYARMRTLERERVLAAERERIMRDVHDGVGGTLASVLVSAEDGQASLPDVAVALRHGLDDLRLMVHSLDPTADELPTLLGALRPRIEPRLARLGIRLVWSIADVPSAAPLGPEGNLQVLRVVQEAVNNAARHSGATTLTLATREAEAGSLVEIADDGRGLDGAVPGSGFANMRRRAERIGGRLELDGGQGGTRVRLWLPRREAPGERESRKAPPG